MPAYSPGKIKKLLAAADAATTTDAKGKLFEDLICYLFAKIPGVSAPQRNLLNRFASEEVDVAFWNDQHPEGLNLLDTPLLIECKNWSVPVDAAAVRDFLGKLRNRGLEFGILVAANGVTGNPEEGDAAHHEIALALTARIRLIVLTRAELEGLKSSKDLVAMIRAKVCQLIVSGTVWP